MLVQMQDWLRDDLPARLNNFEKWRPYLEAGVIYAHGRDKQMRPIMYINMKKLGEIGIDYETLIGLSDYVHCHLVFNAMVPGTIEQWVVIYDCTDASLSKLPISSLGAMVAHGTYAWKQRNSKAFFINVHWIVRTIFSLFQSFLDQF